MFFNKFLEETGINPKDVYLVRHQDTRVSKRILRARRSSPYELWMNQREQFECYQQLQSEDCFRKRTLLASFVGTPWKETLFVGLYIKRGLGKLPKGLFECPVTGESVSNENHCYYTLDRDERLCDMEGKLTIDWGKAYIKWIQLADNQDKPIREIRKAFEPPAFPGFKKFIWEIDLIESIPRSWQSILAASKGIYLQRCKDTGKMYVGKADGDDGFMGRFRNYARTVHGGNIRMIEHKTSGYWVSILEVLSTSFQGDIDEIESLWKDKLGTREKWGLNDN